MQIEVTLNNAKGGVELLFSEKLPIALSTRLKTYGFKPVNDQPLKRYAPQHPAFINYAKALQDILLKGEDFLSVHIQPSFEPSLENIDHNKFSYVVISFSKDEDIKKENYVVFDSYKKVAAAIATHFGRYKYKEAFKGVAVYPRNYKVKARALLKKGKVITGTTDQEEESEGENRQKPLSENEKEDIIQAFFKFTDKRIADSPNPQAIITNRELSIMFSDWFKHNHPKLIHQKEELWDIAEHFKKEHPENPPEQKAKAPYTNAQKVAPVKEKDNTTKQPAKKNDRKRLIELGFKGLFTAQQAFTMPFTVMDLQSRWYDANEYLEETYEKPAYEQIQKWKSDLETIKGKKDRVSIARRKEIGENIRKKMRETRAINALVDNENIAFGQDIIQKIIKWAKTLGHPLEDQEKKSEFSAYISEMLFNERMIEPYYKKTIVEVTGEIVKDFFNKENSADHPNKDNTDKVATVSDPQRQKQPEQQPPKPDTGKNGKAKHLLNNPILDADDGWMMTPLEYQQIKAIERTGNPMILNKRDSDNHELIVKQAIEEKKAVPRHVLAHYPWLIEKTTKENASKQPKNNIKTTALKKFERFISRYHIIDGHLYNGELKATFKRLGKAALDQLAGYLGLKEYQVDFDKLAQGVSGQLSLKGMFAPDKGIYITLNKDGVYNGVLYHSIKNMKDYTGGIDNFFPESEFAAPEVIKTKVYRLLGLEQEQGVGGATKSKYDYLSQVVGHLHEKYADGERPTKKQIEKLGEQLGVPNRGMMWEAAELSWLLWYKQIYDEPLPFEMRLKKMIYFWDNLQPTYAYSDSSKELYKQYSTPCPIGAMIAEYTGMKTAKSIFEPSAGNGLLLVGADPRKTHVNEIDPTRLASLISQGFSRITSDNAAEPFDKRMTKTYDVVVTNPPFTRWEETKTNKEYIVRKYFNGMMGMVQHIRMEHVMAGLALHCMKDDGKAAIIIMGHIYFSDDGYFGKYRPFFNWLYRHYLVSDIINLNSFNLYNKQGAIQQTMLILVNGRKTVPKGVAPTQDEAPHLYDMVNSFEQLWGHIKPHVGNTIDILVKQLKIELEK